uniref:Uncharacterized protein n=1 Tax=Vespula pensylvanica TaxID=30213 RepID=A0A834N566_VESPE|nr:hypothetical protein H0235_016737 [Vespula pensylvanica]
MEDKYNFGESHGGRYKEPDFQQATLPNLLKKRQEGMDGRRQRFFSKENKEVRSVSNEDTQSSIREIDLQSSPEVQKFLSPLVEIDLQSPPGV